MKSVAVAAREIIENRPFLEDALSRNIINYNSLAKEILAEVKTKTKKKDIKITTLSMALRRIGEKDRESYDNKIELKLKDFIGTDTTIKYDLFEITLALDSNKDLGKIISQIYSTIPSHTSDFLSITKGRSELTIITSIQFKNDIKKICKSCQIINETHDLAALSIKIPDDSLVTEGLFYYFTKALTVQGINIAELVSTFSEMQFILDEMDVNDAAKIIRKLVKNTRPFD